MAFGEALLVVVPGRDRGAVAGDAARAGRAAQPGRSAGVGLTAPLPGPATFATAVARRRRRARRADAADAPVRREHRRACGRPSAARPAGRCRSGSGSTSRSSSLAVVALLQLRLYGAPLTRNARGTLGVDPLLVAAPGDRAGRAARCSRSGSCPGSPSSRERVLARARGLVASLGGRQLARRPLRYTRAALLLILAAALGTFASAHAATWTRSQADQAAWTAGVGRPDGAGPAQRHPGLGARRRAAGDPRRRRPRRRSCSAAVDLGLDDPRADARRRSTARRWPTSSGCATTPPARRRSAALRALGGPPPAAPGLALPDGTRRVALTYDSAFTPVEGSRPCPRATRASTANLDLVDGDGRVARLGSEPRSRRRRGRAARRSR